MQTRVIDLKFLLSIVEKKTIMIKMFSGGCGVSDFVRGGVLTPSKPCTQVYQVSISAASSDPVKLKEYLLFYYSVKIKYI